jgi:hypothetical protein
MSNWVLRLNIYDFLVLEDVNARDLLYHEHNLWGITIVVKCVPRNVDDLLQDEVKDGEEPLLHIELNQVPLILRASGSISNPRSQGGTEEAMKSVELWYEILSLWWMSNCTWSIHKVHLFWLENIESVNSRSSPSK